ncbi:type III pantothenate kinase [Spiroplasma helicoides]|uniref:Type III pantothenate kinase n=1 Tax=Spiroplasma helicoides TaxID=216938 RepID=A0A1B3SLF6_9MOLU|nr:type III pantothenate kinase [Spiroplasma helicoides]AOG60776.1 type III pantothenate kinase [Spiroplasma helicoides]
MSILMIDVGNTTVDFRIWDQAKNELSNLMRPKTKDDEYKSSSRIKNLLKENNVTVSEIIYVSVVPEWNDVIRALGQSIDVPIYNLRNVVDISNYQFALDDVNKLGADFLSNFIGALNTYNLENGLVLSLGTASTIFVVQDKKFIGTSISPGLETSLDGLINMASLLKNNTYNKSNKLVGKNTVDSINIGSFNGHFYMVTGLVDFFKKHFKVDKVIFTGGISNLFIKEIKELGYIFDEKLIFEGLIEVFKNIKKG